MDSRLVFTVAVVVAAAAGYVYTQQVPPEDTPPGPGGERMDISDIDARYMEVLSPESESDNPVEISFEAEEEEASGYRIMVDGVMKVSGDLGSRNLERLRLSEGEHSYEIILINESGMEVDSSGTRQVKVSDGVEIELLSPTTSVKSGEEVAFHFSVNGSDTAELFLDGTKQAEKQVDGEEKIILESLESGSHSWTVRTSGKEKSAEFTVSGELPAVVIHEFYVENSPEGWQARADLTAQDVTDYSVYVNSEQVKQGTVQEGESSLGIPLQVEEGSNVWIEFRNARGQVSTREVTAGES